MASPTCCLEPVAHVSVDAAPSLPLDPYHLGHARTRFVADSCEARRAAERIAMFSCFSLRDVDLPMRSSKGAVASSSGIAALSSSAAGPAADWACLPALALDLVVNRLQNDVKSLYGMAGVCAAWRDVALPVLLRRTWKQPKLIHPQQLFTLMPAPVASSRQQLSTVCCMLIRRPALSALDGPTYELWQADSDRDAQPRFLLSARMASSCQFIISMARPGGIAACGPSSPGNGASGSSGAGLGGGLRRFRFTWGPSVDMDCAELLTNMKRTEYELWAARKPWVTKALGELASTCGASFTPIGGGPGSAAGKGSGNGGGWWKRLLALPGSLSSMGKSNGGNACGDSDDGAVPRAGFTGGGVGRGDRYAAPDQDEEGAADPLQDRSLRRVQRWISAGASVSRGRGGMQQVSILPAQYPLLQVHYFMRMHGLLLPRRLVVEVAQPPHTSLMSTNPLFDRSAPTDDDSNDSGDNFALVAGHSGDVSMGGQGGAAALRSPSCDLDGVRDQTDTGLVVQEDRQGAEDGPAWLRLQNVLPHWSPQLKCWCLNFNNRVRQASIKNYQLCQLRPEATGQGQQGHAGAPATASMPVLMQFGKVDTDVFVLDYQPSTMTALQAFALGLSSFERKYSLY